MAFKEQHLREADKQVRRVNNILKRTAEMFGTGSQMYMQREALVKAAMGGSIDLSRNPYLTRDANGVLQISRSRKGLQRASGASARPGLTHVEALKGVKQLRQSLLDKYRERQQAPIQEKINAAAAAGQDTTELEEQLRRADPSYVDPRIKGKDRIKARRQQEEAAIKAQAEYYARLNEQIKEAIQQLYEIERETGQETEAHAMLHHLHPEYSTTEQKEELLKKLLDEISREDHTISGEYEAGLRGNILGVGQGSITD